MKKLMSAFALLFAVSAVASHDVWHDDLCQGFVPENDLYIPEGLKSRGGISKDEFDDILDRVEDLYKDEVRSLGGRLNIKRRWKDGKVNASATQFFGTWTLNMYGGLARHPAITADGFALVACHEMGHHLGGAPKISTVLGKWGSNEGAADYYATLKCLRRFFEEDDNEKIVADLKPEPLAVSTCEKTYSNRHDQLICIRSAVAGASVAALFQNLSKAPVAASLGTPDPRIVTVTYNRHPAFQCRLDTYFAGAVCDVPVEDELDNEDYHKGSCTDASGHEIGLRPRCWFKPDGDPTTEPTDPSTPTPTPEPSEPGEEPGQTPSENQSSETGADQIIPFVAW